MVTVKVVIPASGIYVASSYKADVILSRYMLGSPKGLNAIAQTMRAIAEERAGHEFPTLLGVIDLAVILASFDETD